MAAFPLMLLTLGANLSTIRFYDVTTASIASGLRIGVGLLLGLLTIRLFGLTGVMKNVILLDAAMPSAVVSAVLTAKYDNEAELSSSVVFLTTLAGLVTIPLILHFLT
jgi:hypothetical protein